jgi:hypothetical protein
VKPAWYLSFALTPEERTSAILRGDIVLPEPPMDRTEQNRLLAAKAREGRRRKFFARGAAYAGQRPPIKASSEQANLPDPYALAR